MPRAPQKFLVNIPNYHGEDQWYPWEAVDAQHAAEAAAEDYDQDDYYMLKHEDYQLVVYVKPADATPETVPQRFVVHGYVSYNYSAEHEERSVTDPPDNEQ